MTKQERIDKIHELSSISAKWTRMSDQLLMQELQVVFPAIIKATPLECLRMLMLDRIDKLI